MTRPIALSFHGIGEPHAAVPATERPYWHSRAQFAALLERIWTDHDPARFAFTFDDGNASDREAASLLAERGKTARFFVPVARIDTPHYLSPNDLRAMTQLGAIVGLHGSDHVDWRGLDDAALHRETADARARLADIIGKRVGEVSIPFGRYNARVLDHLAGLGFDRIHTSDGGLLESRSATRWNRNTLRSDMSAAQVERILQGRWSIAQRLRRRLAQAYKSRL